MTDFGAAVNRLGDLANERVSPEPGDYLDENGLLRCGKCGNPKQARIEVGGVPRIVMGLCKCAAEKAEKARTEELHRKYVDALLSRCFFAEEMRGWRFEQDNGSNSTLYSVATKFVENFDEFCAGGRGMLFYGKPGVGKTWYAACIANALIEREIPCKFLDFTQIANILMDLGSGRNDYIRTLARYPLLVIDDLCAERNTSFMDEVVFSVIDARCKAGNPLIVTTNLSRDELRNPTGMNRKRIISRLYEVCVPYEAVGEDQRRAGLKKDYAHYKELLGIGKEDAPRTGADISTNTTT